MAVTIHQRFDSQSATVAVNPASDTKELIYIVQGTESDAGVVLAVEATVPAFYFGRQFQSYRIEHLGDGVWEVYVTYGFTNGPGISGLDQDTTEYSTFRFSTKGGTQHITQSKSTVAKKAAAGKMPPDFKGAIGVQKDGDSITVNGTDIVIPVYNWTEPFTMPLANLTTSYTLTVRNLTGKVNNATFRGFSAGEVLFMGADGGQKNINQAEIAFEFSAIENITGVSIPGLENVDKKGHEYLWILYEEAKDDDAKFTPKRPKAVYVEKVYDSGNFGLLNIGS